MTTRILVLLLTLLLLPANGSEDVFDGGSDSCDVQIFERSVAMKFVGLSENLDADQITVLEEAFKTTYNGFNLCDGDSFRDVVDVEIIVQQGRRLEIKWGWWTNWRMLIQCRGCPSVGNKLFRNDAVRSLQDSACPPCETPTPGDFIANYNIVLHSLANDADNPDNVIGAAVSVSEVEESLTQSVCENFAVHARTTVTFYGELTTIHGGDVGVSPGTSVAGAYRFQDGGVFVDDSSDFAALTVATHAAAMAVRNDETAIGIEIGGSTFTPGTYRSSSAINFAHGTVVTLDGEDDPNSVFLFQAGSTLVTGAGTTFILKNGARAENVLWAIGTAATLGASSVLEGSILAGTAITFGTKSELHGCVLAQTFVTFESEGSIKPAY